MTETIRRGVDYSTRPADWGRFFDALKARGYTVIGRYLGPPRWEKAATREELEAAFERGFSVFFYWETTETRSLEGYPAGLLDAQRALTWLRELGIDREICVYFTVDFDASATQLRGPVSDYFRAIHTVMPRRLIGCYGGYWQVRYLLESGLASYAVQTEAWSFLDGRWPTPPRWYPGAQVRQWTVHGPGVIAGVPCDGLDIVAEDIGAYHPQGGDDDMTPEQDRLLRLCRISDVARSYDIQILRAEIRGDAEKVKQLEAEKVAALAAERKALGLGGS